MNTLEKLKIPCTLFNLKDEAVGHGFVQDLRNEVICARMSRNYSEPVEYQYLGSYREGQIDISIREGFNSNDLLDKLYLKTMNKHFRQLPVIITGYTETLGVYKNTMLINWVESTSSEYTKIINNKRTQRRLEKSNRRMSYANH